MTTYRALFVVREFRFLYGAQVVSYLGDQLAAIAVAVIVFDRTGSGLLTAVAYASAWLPGVVSGPLLAPYADRLPRRTVMITADLARAVLIGLLAVPGLPLGVLIVALYAAHAVSAPFGAARSALMPEVLDGDAYVTGNGLEGITFQLSQVIGFAAGGVVVVWLSARGALAADAVTFAVSALLVAAGVRRHAAVPARRDFAADVTAGLRYVGGDPWLRRCLALVWVGTMVAYAPEAIAYPFARDLGGGPAQAGLLMTAPCVGYAAGAFLLTRVLAPEVRDRVLGPLAVLAAVALVPAVAVPLPVMLALLVAGGAGAAFAAPLNAVFVRRVDPRYRGRVMGVAISGLLAAQGIGFLLTGALVQAGLRPSAVITVAGLCGAVVVTVLAFRWRRAGPVDRAATVDNSLH